MVEEDVGQRRDVFQQRGDRALRQSSEGVVGWCEHGEWAVALESLDQLGGLQRRDERLEAVVRNGDVDDCAVLLRLLLLLRLDLFCSFFGLLFGRRWLSLLLLLIVVGAGNCQRNDQAENGRTSRPDHCFRLETQSQAGLPCRYAAHVVLPIVLWYRLNALSGWTYRVSCGLFTADYRYIYR